MYKRGGDSAGVVVAGTSTAVGGRLKVGFRLLSGVESGAFMYAVGSTVRDTLFISATGVVVGVVVKAGTHAGGVVAVTVVVVPPGAMPRGD